MKIQTTYINWNQALVSYFTTGMAQGSQIYLSVDDDVLESIGQNLLSPEIGGNSCADFCAAVKKAVIVDGQVKLSHLQERDEQGLPKSVAFLSAMVLGAYRMAEDEDVDQNNFFQRFKEILDLPISEYSRPFGMKSGEEESLWQDWALWLRQNGFVPSAQRGEGSRTYINYPISQTLLRQSDKDQLCKIFNDKQWKTQWDAQTLLVRVRQETSKFSKHLQELLTGHQLRSRYEVVAEAIHDVYEQWHHEGCPTAINAASTWSRHLFAGLYRTEAPFSGEIDYYLYPKQPKRRSLESVQVQLGETNHTLRSERPGWYFSLDYKLNVNDLEQGANYPITFPFELEALILPQRDFWILTPDPDNPDAGTYASWGMPSLGLSFILLCKQELLSDIERLRDEQLLKWNGDPLPVLNNANWIELHDCLIVSQAWEGIFIDNQALKAALQPSIHLLVSFSGGLRVSRGTWLVDHAPQVTIFGFYPTVELKVTRLPDNALIYEEVQNTNTPISLNFPMSGEYLVEATSVDESSERLIQIVDWDKLSMTAPQHRETLSIGDEQICGSVIIKKLALSSDKSIREKKTVLSSNKAIRDIREVKKTEHSSDKPVSETNPLSSYQTIREVKKMDRSSEKPVSKTNPLKKSSQMQQLSLF